MPEPVISVSDLIKTYKDRKRGKVEAVKGVSFEAFAGEIFGLLGPNGAGKTTCLRMLATILKPTEGSAFIAGSSVTENPDKARRSFGFMSGDTGLYDRLSAREMVAYFGNLYSLSSDEVNTRVSLLGEKLDMGDFFDRRCAKLSTGQKQKVSIARTVIHDPPVLILDEPTSGLDVLASRNIVSFIRSARDDGKCVVLSTHDMGEAERLCDRIGIIHNGSIVAIGTKQELFNQYNAEDLETVFLRAIGEDNKYV
ncbi:MAG: ATP-binding cassette domain-containing protein [Calditrichaeota bacterium]|jgi:sodium transport system ATP-binding protein|nr:ATP-binding cassette domain-containing protein [Calditrichota bacterium]MBT7616349.1 ATP-binding cassette domain-containing protein [Calditrichota bacterium]MBT7789767.1 ATP-binding cassette domain-containing protein [Calditrichota bacterium]